MKPADISGRSTSDGSVILRSAAVAFVARLAGHRHRPMAIGSWLASLQSQISVLENVSDTRMLWWFSSVVFLCVISMSVFYLFTLPNHCVKIQLCKRPSQMQKPEIFGYVLQNCKKVCYSHLSHLCLSVPSNSPSFCVFHFSNCLSKA